MPETLTKHAKRIFDDRLSKICCTFISTLHIDVLECTWLPCQSTTLIGIVHRRLTRLEKLTVSICCKWPITDPYRPHEALSALAGLNPHIAVELRSYYHRRAFTFRFALAKALREENDIKDAAYLDTIRSKSQRRKDIKVEREQKDETLDILQDTVDLRRLALG